AKVSNALGRNVPPLRDGLTRILAVLVALVWPKRTKVLFTMANTRKDKTLQLEEEVRDTLQAIQDSAKGQTWELVPGFGLRREDLPRYLEKERPQILHFAGHGRLIEGLCLLPERPATPPPGKEAEPETPRGVTRPGTHEPAQTFEGIDAQALATHLRE